MKEKRQVENGFDFDRLTWEASDYFARSWNAERDKPLEKLVEDTRSFLDRNYNPPQKSPTAILDPADRAILGIDQREMGYLGQRLEFAERNTEKGMDPKLWRLSNVVRKEIHDCFEIWLTVFKPEDRISMTFPEFMGQAKRMKDEDPLMVYHSLHRQRRERVRVEANWVDKRDSVNLIIDPVVAIESQGRLLNVTSNEWDEPYPTEMKLYAGLDRGLVNLFSLNNYTIAHLDESKAKVENRLRDLGFVTDRDGVFVKGTLRIRLKNEGRVNTTASIHINEKAIDPVLDERFDLVLRATDVVTASSYGLVAAEMRHGLVNSQMLPDLVQLMDAVKEDFPISLNHKLGKGSLAVKHKPTGYIREETEAESE